MSRGRWMQMQMTEIRRRPVSHCPMIGATEATDHDLNTFCTVCPDACKIPAGCTLSCGWPEWCDTAKCYVSETCPCAHGCSGDRAEQMILWARDRYERRQNVTELLGPEVADQEREKRARKRRGK